MNPEKGEHLVRRHFAISLAALLLAILSKYYKGPLQAIVRGSLGDVLIIVAVYFSLRTFTPSLGARRSLLAVVLLAFAIELLQGFGVFQRNMGSVADYWLGKAFDLSDFIAYLCGAALCLGIDRTLKTSKCQTTSHRDLKNEVG